MKNKHKKLRVTLRTLRLNFFCSWLIKYSFILLFSFFSLISLYAQEKQSNTIFAAALGEVSGYGWDGVAYGGGAAIGVGEGGTLGLRFLYAINNERISIYEINIFARLYVFGPNEFSGYFVQLNGGPVIYTDAKEKPDRSGYGNISVGLTSGWRFMIGSHFFIEPALRLGYPYLAGGGISIGFR